MTGISGKANGLPVGFPELICPRQDVYTMSELSSYNGKGSDAYVAIRGVVYDLDAIIPRHYPSIVPSNMLEKYAGKDATNLFPVQVSALCNGKDGSPWIRLFNLITATRTTLILPIWLQVPTTTHDTTISGGSAMIHDLTGGGSSST